MGTCVVVVDQQAAGASVWTVYTPRLEDLGLANVDVPLGLHCLPLLQRGRGHMTGFGEEDCNYPFGRASRSLEFQRWALTWEKPDLRLLLGFQVIIIIIIIICPLTTRVVWAPQMISQPVSSIFPVLRCPLRLGELQSCPSPDVVFPPLPLSAWWFSLFHCALQDGFGQA